MVSINSHEAEDQIDLFLQAIEEIFTGMNPKTFWPLNGGQIDAYFDVIEALDMYDLLTNLKKTESLQTISSMLPPPDALRLFLEHNAIIGLKVAKKLNIRAITTKEIIDYVNLLFEILSHKVKNDPFCLDGKNLILTNEELEEKLAAPDWDIPSSEQKKEIANLIVQTNNLCYSLYYDIFMAGGFYIHGPYPTTTEFGKDTILLIREYHNLQPKDIWSDIQFPHKKIRVEGVYKHLDIKINFANHPLSTTSIGDKLIAYRLFIDDKKTTLDKLPELFSKIQETTTTQTKKINSLSNLDKVRKGVEIAFYLFKEFRESQEKDWKPPITVEQTIKQFGEKFIEQFKYNEIPKLEHWKKLFDPRNDYY